MHKAEVLERWKEIEPDQNYMEHLVPVPYKQSGSKFGACGLRIEGNPEFVDAVMSHLKDFITAENDVTRLGLSRRTVEPREDKKQSSPYADGNHDVVYIRVHMRGGEAQMSNSAMGVHKEMTERFAELIGADDVTDTEEEE